MKLATSTISVLVASDFPLFRERVDSFLANEPEVDVVGFAEDATSLSELIQKVNPNVVLLDFDVPWDAICQITATLSRHSVPALVVSDPMDSSRTIELLRHGGSGVVGRRTSPELMSKSLRAVAAGELWISRHVTFDVIRLLRGMERDSQSGGLPQKALELLELRMGQGGGGDASESSRSDKAGEQFGLTPREIEVTAAVVDGQTNKDIAESFGISVSTVKHHLTSIFDKLGVYNRVELVLFALNQELVPVDGSPNGSQSPRRT
jgi:two-component system nitrate/nitrite response regulator NarL